MNIETIKQMASAEKLAENYKGCYDVIFKKRLKDGYFLTARYDAAHNKNGGMIKVLIENAAGCEVAMPYCPKGYPMCIFVNGKSKTAFNKALIKANNLASINN